MEEIKYAPQLHIDDMVSAYIYFLKNKKKGTFNIGFENFSINKISSIIKKLINIAK